MANGRKPIEKPPETKEDTRRHPRKPQDDKRTTPGHEGARYGEEDGRPEDTGREGA